MGKVLISSNERHFKASSRIHWEKMAVCQFPTRSFGVTYPKEVTAAPHEATLLFNLLNLIWGSKSMFPSHKPAHGSELLIMFVFLYFMQTGHTRK